MQIVTDIDTDWDTVERGVPITNDNYFVRHDKDTGLIYDDRGGYIHQNNCSIESRREITWITHNQSPICPGSAKDIVLIESVDGELCLTSAYLVIWENVNRYRVIRQQISHHQVCITSNEITKIKQTLNQGGKKLLVSLAIFVTAVFI